MVADSSTGEIWRTVLPHKGPWKYAEIGAAKWLKSLGRACMILQSDSEHSLMKLAEAIRHVMISDMPNMATTTRGPPRFSKRSNDGVAEVSNDTIGCLLRVLLHQVKMQMGEAIMPGNYLCVWAACYVGGLTRGWRKGPTE